MSKQSIAPTRGEGTSTSCTIANSTKTVNKWQAELIDHAITPMIEGANRLIEIEGLLSVIRELIAGARAYSANQGKLREVLRGIDIVAQAGKGRAIDGHDFLANESETLRDETIPAIIAALEGKQ